MPLWEQAGDGAKMEGRIVGPGPSLGSCRESPIFPGTFGTGLFISGCYLNLHALPVLKKLSILCIRDSLSIEKVKMQDTSFLLPHPPASRVRYVTWDVPERSGQVVTQRFGDRRDSVLEVGGNSVRANVEILGTVVAGVPPAGRGP